METKEETTQKTVTVRQVLKLLDSMMYENFYVNGTTYNLISLGWSYGLNRRKRSFGICKVRHRKIELSEWYIENSNNDIDFWLNTILHEIAHAIDYINRGKSDHSCIWKNIALTIGCSGERCGVSNYKENINSKYSLVCDTCGKSTPKHRKPKRDSMACGHCCRKYNGGLYTNKYILKLVRNH